MDNLDRIWSYAMTEWLKLTLHNPDDQTRSRWPVYPLWAALASIDWETSGGPLLRSYPDHLSPSDEWLFNAGLRPVVGLMAKEGLTDFDMGIKSFRERLVSFHEKQAYRFGQSFSTYIRERVHLKVRKYGTGYNLDEIPEEDQRRGALDAAHEAQARKEADEYRRQSGK